MEETETKPGDKPGTLASSCLSALTCKKYWPPLSSFFQVSCEFISLAKQNSKSV